MYKEGTIVTIVNNSYGNNSAAFKRFRKGEENWYEVVYSYPSRQDHRIVCYYVKNGVRARARYCFSSRDLLPKEILEKSLEDYL